MAKPTPTRAPHSPIYGSPAKRDASTEVATPMPQRRQQAAAASVPRFAGSARVEHINAALRETGAVIVDNLISRELADRVTDELQPHFDAVGYDDADIFNGFSTRRVYEVLARAPSSAELMALPQLLSLVDNVLLPFCDSYRIGSSSAIQIMPGEKAQMVHRDDTIYPVHIPGVELQVSALWALTDFTEHNGGTRVVLGSHGSLAGNQGAGSGSLALPGIAQEGDGTYSSYPLDDTVPAEMPKGSLLMYLPSLANISLFAFVNSPLTLGRTFTHQFAGTRYLGSTHHAGGANMSTDPRLALVNTYSLGWLRQEENHMLAIPRHVAVELPRRVRQLMGYQGHNGMLGVSTHAILGRTVSRTFQECT